VLLAGLLLQAKVRVVDGMLRNDFSHWCKNLSSNAATLFQAVWPTKSNNLVTYCT